MPGRAATPPGQTGNNIQTNGQHNGKGLPPLPTGHQWRQPASANSHRAQIEPENKEQSVNLTRLPPITIVKDEKTWKDHLFDWGPWVFGGLLVLVGIFQIALIRRQAYIMEQQAGFSEHTLAAIQRQAVLQQATMQQWVNINEWESEISENKKTLDIRFKVVNPTKFPLWVSESKMVFGFPGITATPLIDPGERLMPDIPKPVQVTISMTPDETQKFTVGVGITLPVRVEIIHTDMGSNEETPTRFSGYLKCQNGRGNTRFDATAKITL